MSDFVVNHWQFICLIFLGCLSFFVPTFRGIWKIAFKALLSEAVMQKMFVKLAESLVESTKNELTEIWLEELKKTLNLPRSDTSK